MGSLPTRLDSAATQEAKKMTKRHVAAALALMTLICSRAEARFEPSWNGQTEPPNLCATKELMLATCPVGRRIASICEQGQGRSVYRFGRYGHIELQATGLRHSNQGYPGGGETQVYFKRGAYRYIFLDLMVRTGYGPDGLHNPVSVGVLLLQHGGKFRILSRCPGVDPVILSDKVDQYMPIGPFIEHGSVDERILAPEFRRLNLRYGKD